MIPEKVWFMIKETDGVGDFIGSNGKPSPMTAKDEQKIVASRQEMLGPTTRALLNDLNGPRFLDCMMRLSGITGLIPDPYFASAGL